MHSLCIVVGDDVRRALAPFSGHLKVERYRIRLEPPAMAAIAAHAGVDVHDREGLARRLPEWTGAEGGADGGRLFVCSSENPRRKYDWCRAGGRFSGCLHLKDRAGPALRRPLLGRAGAVTADRAKKARIDRQVVCDEPPAALAVGGVWHECPPAPGESEALSWAQDDEKLPAAVPDGALLTVVDLRP